MSDNPILYEVNVRSVIVGGKTLSPGDTFEACNPSWEAYALSVGLITAVSATRASEPVVGSIEPEQVAEEVPEIVKQEVKSPNAFSSLFGSTRESEER